MTKVAAGWVHSLFLKSDGSLWAMGRGYEGELGDGTYNQTNRPELIIASNVTAIAAGYEHSLFLKSDGSLWAMGYNYDGELGDGTYNLVFPSGTNQPEQIVASNVVAIAAGGEHSLFLKSDGSLWVMGLNDFGQLGDGTYKSKTNQPEKIVSNNVTKIAAGDNFSLFIKCDGSLWGMGNNSDGELGDGNLIRGSTTNQPELIVASNVIAVAAGSAHSLFLKSDGSVWAMGDNFYGELGDNTNNNTNRPELIISSNVTAIAAGGHHSLFLKSDGSLWAVGENDSGELGDGTFGAWPTYGTNHIEQIVPSGVNGISAGGYHSLFIKSDGSLWAMGANGYGELGDGTYADTSPFGTNQPQQIVVNPSYNQISGQILNSGKVQLSFVGIAGTNYALDRSFSLSPPNWIPLATNPANSFGALVFTNTPDPSMNNFWRIRSVP